MSHFGASQPLALPKTVVVWWLLAIRFNLLHVRLICRPLGKMNASMD